MTAPPIDGTRVRPARSTDRLGLAGRAVFAADPAAEAKRIDLPDDVRSSVYERMTSERQREAQQLRSRGQELAIGIEADADRQEAVLLAEAYRDSETIRGEGDAQAAAIYAQAFAQDPEFYAFTRRLDSYRETFASQSDVLLLDPNSDYFRYLHGEDPAPAAAQ